jgi:hypothetical protein
MNTDKHPCPEWDNTTTTTTTTNNNNNNNNNDIHHYMEQGNLLGKLTVAQLQLNSLSQKLEYHYQIHSSSPLFTNLREMNPV